jgi:CHAT domain-containing protein/cytochrome c-type biogenesis protein CcmH/NrfG
LDSASEHLGEPELAKLLEKARQSPKSDGDGSDVHPHFAVCSECREQFHALSLFDSQLKNLKPPSSATRQSDCPDEEVWREIAGGLTPPDWTLTCVEHASRCKHCGPLLQGGVAELSALKGEVTESERKQITELESARAEWQQRLSQRIAGTTSGDAERKSRWQYWFAFPRLAAVGVSLLAIIAAGSWFVVNRKQPAAADQLLARAYTEKRTLELRIAGASYAPLRVSLGPAASFTSRPPALLKAEALIASRLAAQPSDPAWLQAEARADVLEGKYDAAVQALRRALELQPHSSALLIDLGTAYFQRALQEDRKEDFGAAYEYLSQALQGQPDEPVALFNRAIVAEHQFLYQQALDDWQHYLKVDSTSQWAEEARNRANAVREKLKDHLSNATPLLSPAELVASDGPNHNSEVDERIEEYLHEAVRSWLPQAFPEAKASSDANALRALFFLAELTSRQHGDRWMADLLQGSSAPNFSSAVNSLARAVHANDAGEFDVSRQQAERAEKLFRTSGNAAGTLRAEFERSFADQISRRSEDCRRRSIAAGAEAKRYSYPWVQIQLELEESVCSVLMGDLGTYEKAARHAQDRAQQIRYGGLYLRALGFVAISRFDIGDRSAGWRLICDGLSRYWSGQLPVMQGYNLYYELAYPAGSAGQRNLELANWREAVALIDGNEDLLLRADAHSNMAKAAKAARQPEVAAKQYVEAARLYALAPQTEATRVGRLESEIRTAQFEARQGAVDGALALLTRAQDEVRQLSNNYLAQIFYATLGEVQLDRRHAAEAEQAFRPALRLAEQNLASLASEAERTSWSKDAAPVYLGLAEAQLVQGRDQEALDTFEWYLGAPQRVAKRHGDLLKPNPEPAQSQPDSSSLIARLPLLSSQSVLAYGVLPDGLAIWLYDNRGVSAKWIPKSPEELQDQSASFYERCSDPGSDLAVLRRDSQSLYSLLIAPMEERLDPHRTLVVETEGALDRLPFEALIDASGRYLVERWPIVHSPGLYAEGRMHPEGVISADLSVLIAGSEAASPDTGLFVAPNVSASVDAVAAHFHFPRVLKGPGATLRALSEALPGAALFHFAGHSVTSLSHTGLMLVGKDPRTGAAVLFDASVVRSLSLENMQLAVLAACNTDSGEGTSRGFDSVARALQSSGVPHVVASRWAVDALESNVFMDSFYSLLLSGDPVSEATRATSRQMLSGQRTAHPYHWAAFAAYGRP